MLVIVGYFHKYYWAIPFLHLFDINISVGADELTIALKEWHFSEMRRKPISGEGDNPFKTPLPIVVNVWACAADDDIPNCR